MSANLLRETIVVQLLLTFALKPLSTGSCTKRTCGLKQSKSNSIFRIWGSCIHCAVTHFCVLTPKLLFYILRRFINNRVETTDYKIDRDSSVIRYDNTRNKWLDFPRQLICSVKRLLYSCYLVFGLTLLSTGSCAKRTCGLKPSKSNSIFRWWGSCVHSVV